jgi:hypothetical protein
MNIQQNEHFETAQKSLEQFNSMAESLNLPKMALIDPKNCVGQEKNARYFAPEVFEQLTENIKADGRLESVPLVYPHESIEGKYRIISGHHRIAGAVKAGLSYIIVFLIEPKSHDEIRSKQLSHNALVGKDDKMILKELFNEIEDIVLKSATGIQFDLDKVDYASLTFRIGTYKEMLLLFLPDEGDKFEEVLKEIDNTSVIGSESNVIIGNLNIFERFAETLRTVKKVKNIKSNPTAIARMVEIVEKWLAENAQQNIQK